MEVHPGHIARWLCIAGRRSPVACVLFFFSVPP
jgi:hypothetical protein